MRTKRRAGFTLIEVLIAIAIFAFMATILAMSYLNVLQGYETAARANETDEDVGFARAQMLAEPDRKVIEEGGEFDSVNSRHVKWNATIVSTEINDLFTVTFEVEVTDPAKTAPQKVTETFTVLRPTWSDPAERGTLLQAAKDKIAQLKEKK